VKAERVFANNIGAVGNRAFVVGVCV